MPWLESDTMDARLQFTRDAQSDDHESDQHTMAALCALRHKPCRVARWLDEFADRSAGAPAAVVFAAQRVDEPVSATADSRLHRVSVTRYLSLIHI